MKVNVKELKCSKCKIKVPYNPEALDCAIEYCDETVHGRTCGISDMVDFIERMENKVEGKPKNLILPVQPMTHNPGIKQGRGRTIEEFEAEQQEANPDLYINKELKIADLEVPDLMKITIDKRGQIHIETVRE